jgi:hypothetical protein
MEYFGRIISMIILLAVTVIIAAYVFSKLWLWFIVPVFEVNSLRLVEAIGIFILIIFVTAKRGKDLEEDDYWKDFINKVKFSVTFSFLSLLLGYITKLFL